MQTFLSGQMAYTDLADEYDPQFSGLFNWKNAEGTFGAMIAAIYQERNIRRDGVETLTYDTRTVNGQAGMLVPGLIGSALFTQERVRKGVNFAAQWEMADNFDVTIEGLYSKFDADNTNENFLAWGSRAINNGGTMTNATIQNGTAVAGTISSLNNGTGDFGVVYDAINRFASAETRSIDFDFGWRPADGWDLHFKVGYTDAEGNTDSQPFVEFGAPATFTYDLRGKAPQVSFANVDPTDPNDMQFIFSSLHQILNDDEEKYGYVDATRELEWGALNSIKFGAKYTNHERDLVFNAHHVRRLPRADQQHAGLAVRGRSDAGRLPRRDLGAGHAGRLLADQQGRGQQHPVRQSDGAPRVLSAAELLGDGEGERRLRHGKSQR